MAKSIEFDSLRSAIDHATKEGGWIFKGENGQVIWFDASCYTPTAIMKAFRGSGFIGGYNAF